MYLHHSCRAIAHSLMSTLVSWQQDDISEVGSSAQSWKGLTHLELDNWTDGEDWLPFIAAVGCFSDLKELTLFNYVEPASTTSSGNGHVDLLLLSS